jgi:hypothetical protein
LCELVHQVITFLRIVSPSTAAFDMKCPSKLRLPIGIYKANIRLYSSFKKVIVLLFLAPKSVNKTRSPTPRWLQAACGKLLSERLVQKDGVLNVLRGVLDLGGDSGDPQKFQIIAQVISNPPSTGSYSDLVCSISLTYTYSDGHKVVCVCVCVCVCGCVNKF